MKSVKSTAVFFIAIVATFCMIHVHATSAPVQKTASLIVKANHETGAIDLTLKIHNPDSPNGVETAITKSIADGIAAWESFDTWYEELFALTYLTSDHGRLWKKLRDKGSKMGRQFFTPDMLKALSDSDLLVVVDETRPFPADVFRFGDKWLFEIVPIVHSFTEGPKDISDDYEYKTAFVMDLQGPGDREGEEAPGVAAHLKTIEGVESELVTTLTNETAAEGLVLHKADVIHLATHAHPDEFFPGRGKPGITVEELKKLKTEYRTFFSTGCHTGNPLFANAVIDEYTRFFIASMYTTSGADGIVFGGAFYDQLFAGKSPFESFYAVKERITVDKPDMPDILRFVFFVR